MEKYQDGLTRITRDESRVIKRAASLLGKMELFEICTHYLAVRSNMSPRQMEAKRTPLVSQQFENGALVEELRQLDVHVERTSLGDQPSEEVDTSVYGVRYVYGPKLANAAREVVRTAFQADLLSDKENKIAAIMAHEPDLVSTIE